MSKETTVSWFDSASARSRSARCWSANLALQGLGALARLVEAGLECLHFGCQTRAFLSRRASFAPVFACRRLPVDVWLASSGGNSSRITHLPPRPAENLPRPWLRGDGAEDQDPERGVACGAPRVQGRWRRQSELPHRLQRDGLKLRGTSSGVRSRARARPRVRGEPRPLELHQGLGTTPCCRTRAASRSISSSARPAKGLSSRRVSSSIASQARGQSWQRERRASP